MKQFFVLMVLCVGLVSCFWESDDPVAPPSYNKVFQIEFISATPLSGWVAEVQYLGLPDGYMGRYNINAQDKTVEWNSQYDPSQQVQVVVSGLAGEFAIFLIDADKYVKTQNGVSDTFNGQGWKEFSTNVWHVQVDCR